MSLTLESAREAKPQLGEFDRNILCSDCDGLIGKLDSYAIDICNEFEKTHTRISKRIFEVQNFDSERFAKFIASLLWRASVSRRPSFESVNLGPYNDLFREAVFGKRSIWSIGALEIMIQRFTSSHLDMKGIYTLPIRTYFKGLNVYSMMLSGFRIIAKLDRVPLGRNIKPLILNETKVLRGPFVEFESTVEFERVKEIAVAHLRRTEGVPTPL